MVDLITIGIAVVVVAAVFIRKTSGGVAILSLLAGVLLNQLLGDWLVNMLPSTATAASENVPVVVRLLVLFTPVVAALVAVKVHKQNTILSLLTGLVLGFLVVLFGLEVIKNLPFVKDAAANAGLIHFLSPYKNAILSASATLAVVEMVMSHNAGLVSKKKKSSKD